jgi:hypothetical protein
MVIEYRIQIGGGSAITQSVELGNGGTTGTGTSAASAQLPSIPANEEPIQHASVGSQHNATGQPRPRDPTGAAGRGREGAGDQSPTGTGGGDPGSGTIIVFGPVIFLGSAPGHREKKSVGSSTSTSATTAE